MSERTFDALVAAIGEEAARKLCKNFGGEQIYVPKKTVIDHPGLPSIKAIVDARGVSARHARRIRKKMLCQINQKEQKP